MRNHACEFLHPLRFLSSPPTTLQSLLQSHAFLTTCGLSSNPFFAAKLISLYSSFHLPDSSSRVFFASSPDPFLWNSAIKAHFDNALPLHCLRLYHLMRHFGVLPTRFTIPMVVSSCAEIDDEYKSIGFSLHGLSVKCCMMDNELGAGVGSSFVYFYSRCGRVQDARKVFDGISQRDVVLWTAMMVGLVMNGKVELGLGCFKEMMRDGVKPNLRTVECGLQACGSVDALWEGKCLHEFAVKTGISCWDSVKCSILSLYSKCGGCREATFIFEELQKKDILSWTRVVGSYAKRGLMGDCLVMFQTILASEIAPDGVFISCLISGFASSGSLYGGKASHAIVLRRNIEFDATVSNALLSSYWKLGLLNCAETIFEKMGERDAASWNLMVAGYGKMELSFKCLDLFREMQFIHTSYRPDLDSILSTIASCSHLGELNLGKSIHCWAIRSKDDDCSLIMNALINMYGQCGKLDDARKMFRCVKRDASTWNTLISIYGKSKKFTDALSLFNEMHQENITPNATTLRIVLSLCSSTASFQQGELIHKYIKDQGLEHDLELATSLVDMFAKCGHLTKAREIFHSIQEKDVVAWNAMISGYGNHGFAGEALCMFKHMEESGMHPNEVTFLALMSACSQAGLMEEGKHLFSRMINFYSLKPTCKHYTCMINLLGKSGNLKEAEDMILHMPIPYDGAVWGALLGACKLHNNIELGKRAAKRAFEMDPDNDGYYILLANLYDSNRMWEDAEKVSNAMKNTGIAKTTGWSALDLHVDS